MLLMKKTNNMGIAYCNECLIIGYLNVVLCKESQKKWLKIKSYDFTPYDQITQRFVFCTYY